MQKSLLRFLFRKMWNTRWMTFSTLLGLIIAVAFSTSIPLYSNGSLKNVVENSLQEENEGYPAGSMIISYQTVGINNAPDLADVQAVDQYIANEVPNSIDFPTYNYVRTYSLNSSTIKPVDPDADSSRKREMKIVSFTDLEENVEINEGTMFSKEVNNDVVEAVVLRNALYRNYIAVGDEFLYTVKGAGNKQVKIKIVGSIEQKEPASSDDRYWFNSEESLTNALFIDEEVFQQHLLEEKNISLADAKWYFNFNLTDIQTSQLAGMVNAIERIELEVYQQLKNTKLIHSFKDMLIEFRATSLQLQSLLFMLAAPMIAMVIYYISMNAKQALDRQRSDITVFRSRGGSTRQIFFLYLLEGMILGVIALVIGPIFGWFLAKGIGSANGFLTFVNRQSIPVDINMDAIIYALVTVVIAIAASVLPAISYSKQSIVGLRKSMARGDKKPFWMRWYLDVVLVLVSAYGWYLFDTSSYLQMQLSSEQMQIQPTLFFFPALTIFSVGLVFLRIFPWILALVRKMTGRVLPVHFYLTLAQLSRSAKSYYPLMILLILTIGLGVYNSSAARTIDVNSTERLMYQYGTDLVVEHVWEGFADPEALRQQQQQNNSGGGEGGNQNQQRDIPMLLREPPFEIFKTLPNVQAASRVLVTDGNPSIAGKSAGKGTVMGIDNVDFASVAWFREDTLFPHSYATVLSQLGKHENGVIVPQSLADKFQLERGDTINLTVEQKTMELVVVYITPYWPSLYPEDRPFFVMNLDYLYSEVEKKIRYKVWLKMEEGASAVPVINQLDEAGIELVDATDMRYELQQQQRQPSRGGVFGILSLGFLISVVISLIGYIIYWFFNLSNRILQLGILRAMGLSRKQLTGMLLLEQVFTAGIAIALGFIIGRIASIIYLPFLETMESTKNLTPDYRVITSSQDLIQLFIVVGVMMLIGAGLLFMHIRRLKVHQAIKMGEER
ncbi:ABC transporter permease [Longirhabdus pacifica]|uniref:ABC transporter permease n=1 Tax=Longirhabdus pacifica TaxID=2305227 RepID=UPI0010087049|nr:FtsX-like permease family protein [Longirhabdus pacifica]